MSSEAIRVLATGDTIANRRLVDDGRDFTALAGLVQGADVAFTNMEFTTPSEPLTPAAESQGGYIHSPPWMLDELRDFGFNLFNVANNHAIDYTSQGITDTIRELRRRELVYAGAGHNLAEARAPGYLETSRGRVALIGVTSSFPTGAQAGPGRDDVGGRPGINPLRYDTQYLLDERRLEYLREIDEVLGTGAVVKRWLDAGFEHHIPSGAYPFLKFLGDPLHFYAADEPGVRTRSHEGDLEAIARQVRAATRQADVVLVSVHAHEGQAGDINCLDAADFVYECCRALVDAGADAVIGHGPHVMRPVEIYRGKPIFYSLGNFMFMTGTVERFPAEMYARYGLPPDATAADIHDRQMHREDGQPAGFHTDDTYWESFVPICQFTGGDAQSVELHPIVLTRSPRARAGAPRLASAEHGHRILDRLAEISKPFGTELRIDRARERSVGRLELG